MPERTRARAHTHTNLQSFGRLVELVREILNLGFKSRLLLRGVSIFRLHTRLFVSALAQWSFDLKS